MCQNRPINLTISLPSPRPNHMPPLLPLPSSCLQGCMTLKCCGNVTIWIYNLENKKLCYVEGTLSDMYCCRKEGMGQGRNKTVHRLELCVLNGVIYCLVVNQHNGRNKTCQLARPDMQHGDKKNRDKENSDMSGGGDHKLIAGIVGSLIVLLLVAIFVVLLVQILRKRRHGHTPPGKVTHMQQRRHKHCFVHYMPFPE